MKHFNYKTHEYYQEQLDAIEKIDDKNVKARRHARIYSDELTTIFTALEKLQQVEKTSQELQLMKSAEDCVLTNPKGFQILVNSEGEILALCWEAQE